MTASLAASDASEIAEVSIPAPMRTAVERLREICETMFGFALEPNGVPTMLRGDDLAYAAAISVIRPSGSWEIGLFGDDASSKNFTRAMLAMEEDETPSDEEIVDAYGELVNMVSGMVKRSRSEQEQSEIQIGVPLFLLGDDCRKVVPRVIEAYAQPIGCDEFEGSLLLVWIERTPIGLLREIDAELEEGGHEDKLALGRVLALCDELHEFLSQSGSESMEAAIEDCRGLVMELINESNARSACVLQAVLTTIAAIRAALETGTPDAEIESPNDLIADAGSPGDDPAAAPPQAVERDEETLETFQEFLEESEDGLDTIDEVLMQVEAGSGDAEAINQLFRTYHTIKGVSGFLDLNDVQSLAHITETLLAECRDGKRELTGFALDLVFESAGLMRRLLASTRTAVENGHAFVALPEVADLIAQLKAVLEGKEPPPRQNVAPAANAPAAKSDAPKAKLKPVMKVEVELVEELEAHLASLDALASVLTSGGADAITTEQLGSLGEVAGALRATSTRMRMVTVAGMFQKMARMVRDLSKKTEKLTRLVLAGEDTKIARSVIDKVGEPLVHMIRNAVDHGIEATPDRQQSGKPLLGTISLSARQQDDRVLIEIRDDGKGLRREIILGKAVEKGLVQADAELTDNEVFQLIMAPGFSTAPKVTAISGRGVGMDVVKKNIEGAGGIIHIASTPGAGSTFTLSLPLIPAVK